MSNMKTVITVILSCFSTILLSQEVIQNTDTPKSPGAGRVIQIEEVFVVPETGDDYVLQNPRMLKISDKGDFVILDQTAVLEFDNNMKHIRTYAPEQEQVMLHNMQLTGDLIHAYNRMYPPYLYTFNRNNDKVKKLMARDRLHMFLYEYLNRFYFMGSSMYSLNEKGKDYKEEASLKVKSDETIDGRSRIVVTQDPKTAIDMDAELAYVSNTPEYLIKQIDLKTSEILRTFSRPYDRVPSGAQPPWPEYKLDILNVLFANDQIWAITSTDDKKKGKLVDVYNQSGEYMDAFWISCREKGKPMLFSARHIAVHGNQVYVLYTDSKDRVKIGKGEINGKNLYNNP